MKARPYAQPNADGLSRWRPINHVHACSCLGDELSTLRFYRRREIGGRKKASRSAAASTLTGPSLQPCGP